MHLLKKSPIKCYHDCVVTSITALEVGEEKSQGIIDMLERCQASLVKIYGDLWSIHLLLVKEVIEVEYGELKGYDDIYSDEALERYLDSFTKTYLNTSHHVEQKLQDPQYSARRDEVRSDNSLSNDNRQGITLKHIQQGDAADEIEERNVTQKGKNMK